MESSQNAYKSPLVTQYALAFYLKLQNTVQAPTVPGLVTYSDVFLPPSDFQFASMRHSHVVVTSGNVLLHSGSRPSTNAVRVFAITLLPG